MGDAKVAEEKKADVRFQVKFFQPGLM